MTKRDTVTPVTPVSKSLFNKLQLFRLLTLLTRDPTVVFSCEICEVFKNTYFEKHLRTTASEICSFTWTALFDNFWLKLVPMLY